MTNLPEEVLKVINQKVQEKAKEIDYGKVTVEVDLAEGGSFVDVVFTHTERVRIEKDQVPKPGVPYVKKRFVKVDRSQKSNY